MPPEVALIDLLIRICETPAPTFHEGARARLVASEFEALGLEVQTDDAGNVIAPLGFGEGPRILVAAHLHTVFGPETDVTVRREGERLLAPGIGDNSASLAVMLTFARWARAQGCPGLPRITLAATTGEEGLGDLCGARALVATKADETDMFVALDGHLGTVVESAVGSKRYEVTFRAAGGHSWGDFPAPSAVHTLADAVHALNRMRIPQQPRSSYNVGQICGGTSVNAIAQEASFNLDLRSLAGSVLEELEREALGLIRKVSRHHGVECVLEKVGDRPAGSADNGVMIRAARTSLENLKIPVQTVASSTDANAAMAAGLPAIGFGVYCGGDAHRLSEWLEPSSLRVGLEAFRQLLRNLGRWGI